MWEPGQSQNPAKTHRKNSLLEEESPGGGKKKKRPEKQVQQGGRGDKRAKAASYVTVVLAPLKTHSRCLANIS